MASAWCVDLATVTNNKIRFWNSLSNIGSNLPISMFPQRRALWLNRPECIDQLPSHTYTPHTHARTRARTHTHTTYICVDVGVLNCSEYLVNQVTFIYTPSNTHLQMIHIYINLSMLRVYKHASIIARLLFSFSIKIRLRKFWRKLIDKYQVDCTKISNEYVFHNPVSGLQIDVVLPKLLGIKSTTFLVLLLLLPITYKATYYQAGY